MKTMNSTSSDPQPVFSEEQRWLELLTREWREPGDLDAILNHIAEVAKEAFAADLCVIFAINPITRRFADKPGVAGDLFLDVGESSLKEPREHGLTQRVISEGYLAVEDLATLDEDEKGFCLRQRVRSFAAVALHTVRHEKPFAALYVDYRRSKVLDADLENRLRRFSRVASRELQITWFLRRYQRVGQMGQEISRHFRTEKQLFMAVWHKVRQIIDTSHCFLCAFYHPENDTLDIFSSVDGREHFEKGRPVDGPLGRLLKGEVQLVKALDDETAGMLSKVEGLPGSLSWKPQSLVFVPLNMEGKPQGILSVQHSVPNAYDDEDRHLLELVGNQVALALSNLRLYSHLSRLHEVGKTLTRDLESKTVLQTVVEAIRTTTGCDLAILYPYSAAASFELPPKCSGDFRDKSIRQPRYVEPGGFVESVLSLPKPLFAEDAQEGFRPASRTRKTTGSFQEREGVRSVAALPLRVGEGDDEAVGALFVNYRTRQRFDDDPALKQLILGMASYAAIAIKNARAFGAEQSRYVKTLEAVRDLDRELSRHPDDLDRLLDIILEIAIERLAERVCPDEASILLYDPVKDELVTRAAKGVHSGKSLSQKLRPEDKIGISLEVLRTGEPILVPDVQTSEWRGRSVSVGGRTRSEMDVPLKDGDQVLGVINLESRRVRAFGEADLQLMQTLAGQAVLAVKTSQAFEQEKHLREQEQRLREDEETLIELGKELTQRLDVEDLLDLILRRAIENTRAQAGVLVLVDSKQGELIVKAERGVPGGELGRRLKWHEGILGLVAREGHMVNADLTDPKWKKIHNPVVPNMKSEIALPLEEDGRVVGVLNVESPELRYFGERNEKLLSGLADLAVIALQNAERFETSERRLERFEVLYQASQELARIATQDQLDEAYEVVVSLAAKQWECVVVIRRLGPEGLRKVKSTGPRDSALFDVIPLSDPLAGKVVTERRTIYVPDALNPPPDVGQFPRSSNKDLAFIVTSISFKNHYYGNLSLSHSKLDYFRDADVRLVEGLAKQLAIAIHRVEEVEAHQKIEKRALELETMGEVGRQTYELMHRLGNDLGLVRTSARKIRATLQVAGGVDPVIEAELSKIVNDVRGVLGISRKLATELSKNRHGDPQVYPVRELLQHGIDSLSLDEDKRRRIQVELDLSQDPMAVKVDYRRFSDAFLNLLRNAVEAMPDGGRLTVGTRQRSSKVEIRVEDTGRGISSGILPRLFDLGYTTKPGSSGFGLWSVKRSIVYSGGDIEVESQPGRGTKFTIALPYVKEKPNA